MTVGLNKLDELFSSTRGEMPEYVALARLYDTFGTPRDLIRVGLEERGVAMEEEQFNKSFDVALQQLQQTGATGKDEGKAKTNPIYATIANRLGRSQFMGYESVLIERSSVLALLNGGEVQSLNEGDEGEVVLNQTPFYAESGGQVGDVGRLTNSPAIADGTDFTQRGRYICTGAGSGVHKGKVEKGTLKIGDTVMAEVTWKSGMPRAAITRPRT